MATRETNLTTLCAQVAGKLGARVFRNNRGMFKTMDLKRTVRAGLEVPGAADLIGWTPVKITQGMVGQTVAVFCALEVKTETGRASDDQVHFIDVVKKSGGIAGIVKSDEDVYVLLGQERLL